MAAIVGEGLVTFRDPDPRKDVILVGLEEVEVSRWAGRSGGGWHPPGGVKELKVSRWAGMRGSARGGGGGGGGGGLFL
jgi:hypothetical protein